MVAWYWIPISLVAGTLIGIFVEALLVAADVGDD